MTDRWANIAFFYLTVILVMNSLIIIVGPTLPDENRLFDSGENIAEGIPDTDIKIQTWYEDNIIANFVLGGAAIIGADELLRLGFEFAATVLSVGNQTISFLMSALFIYGEVFERIGSKFGLDPAFAVMLSSMLFIAQILAIIIIASRVREVLRL